jgi:hypothetical protein
MNFFLHDGIRTRNEIIPPLVKKLRLLYAALKSQESFEFVARLLFFLFIFLF